jgi:hypothetical protein
MSTPAVTCRVPDPVAEKYERAAKEREQLKSEVVRSALRFYMEENPDEFVAFGHADARQQEEGQASVAAVVDDDVEADDSEGEGGDDGVSSGVYDPTEDC